MLNQAEVQKFNTLLTKVQQLQWPAGSYPYGMVLQGGLVKLQVFLDQPYDLKDIELSFTAVNDVHIHEVVKNIFTDTIVNISLSFE